MFGIDSGANVNKLSKKWTEDEGEEDETEEIEEEMERDTEYKSREEENKNRKQVNGDAAQTEEENFQVNSVCEWGGEVNGDTTFLLPIPFPSISHPLHSNRPVPGHCFSVSIHILTTHLQLISHH